MTEPTIGQAVVAQLRANALEAAQNMGVDESVTAGYVNLMVETSAWILRSISHLIRDQAGEFTTTATNLRNEAGVCDEPERSFRVGQANALESAHEIHVHLSEVLRQASLEVQDIVES